MGREILSALSTADLWKAVHALGRRPLAFSDPKLTSHVGDLQDPPALPQIDDAFITLGTTIKVAGSREAFRAVDFDAVLSVARAARKAGATRLAVVSAMGADAASSIFYNRVKGEMEDAVSQLGFETLVIARPSMLDGDRESLSQAPRPAERWTLAAMRLIRPLIPANYRPVAAARVAAALIDAMAAGDPGKRLLLSGELQKH